MPKRAQHVPELARKQGWRMRPRSGRGGGFEYHISSLPRAAQDALVLTVTVIDKEQHSGSEDLDRLPKSMRDKAARQLEIVAAVEALMRTGMTQAGAAAQLGVPERTVRRMRARVRGQDRAKWLHALAPRYVRNTTDRVEIDAEDWDMFRADYLRAEAPAAAACYDRMCRTAAVAGRTVPSARTFYRRLQQIPRQVRLYARGGNDALKAAYPAQQRDRSVFEALEAVNADGHRFDVFVKWPDGSIGRPVMLAWQDIFSGKLLAHRVDRTEHRDLVRLSFGDMVDKFGVPRVAYLDNGKAFASKWLTGGQETRYRFKIRAEEPLGVLTQMGVEVCWATPYAGQSKPIERAFRDLCEYVAKHPAFSGAYTGNAPDAKPENYGAKAIPIEKFLAVLEQEIAAHNARSGRRSPTCRGRSFDETFNESYKNATIRTASADQRRLWLLAAEGVNASRVDGSIQIGDNRYWTEALGQHAGERVTVRFDPADLHGDVHVYAQRGEIYIGAARCIAPVGFNSHEAARTHARNRSDWMKAHKAQLAAENRMSAAEVAARLPVRGEEPPPPNAKVVRPHFRNPMPARRVEHVEHDDAAHRARAEFSDNLILKGWQRLKDTAL